MLWMFLGKSSYKYCHWNFVPIKLHLVYIMMLLTKYFLIASLMSVMSYKGVARANRSIRIISARGQGAAQGPQWVQGKALVGGPGGKAPPPPEAPGFDQIYILQNLFAWVCFVLPTVHYLCFTVRSYVSEMDIENTYWG
jgi:hypothetical protein